MKTIFSVLVGLVMTSMVYAQTQPTVTINVTGNRNREVAVDGKSYTVNNTTTTEEQSIVIRDLSIGQHLLEVSRSNTLSGSRTKTRTYFNVRSGYDLTITVGSGGAVSTAEARIGSGNVNNGRPITTAQYNRLYSQVRARNGSSARTTYLDNEFTNTNKLFSSRQASQLIALVNSESSRLTLAKHAYPRITDRENFSLVSNLLNSSYNRTELSNYIASLDLDDDDENNTGTPLTDARFRTIYNEVNAETSSYDRYYYLSNFFNKDYNFYTSSQAAQLIQLVQGEEERFQLAKTAYRGTTDKTNYGVVSQLLGNTANRSALTAYINDFNNSNSDVIVAMTDARFNTLYNTIYYQNTTARYNSIMTAFTTAGNYFTVAQAKRLITLVNTESSRLALAKTVYRALVDRSNYTQFHEFLPSSASRNELYNYVVNYSNTGGQNGYAMSEYDFNRIYQNINGTWSSSSRVNLASSAFSTSSNYFSTEQVRKILLLISSESDRLSLAKNAFDNTVDRTNYSLLYDLFSSSSYKNDLANFVANNGAGVVVPVAMSDSEFSSMYRDVQLTFGFGAKMSSLTRIFNNEANRFSVQQAKQLASLVSAESNRLELAKLAYNNVVDPENYTAMYDLLSSQSSKNELAAFVNSNASVR